MPVRSCKDCKYWDKEAVECMRYPPQQETGYPPADRGCGEWKPEKQGAKHGQKKSNAY